MIIHFTLNGAPQELTVNPGENVQKLLFNMGMHSVLMNPLMIFIKIIKLR